MVIAAPSKTDKVQRQDVRVLNSFPRPDSGTVDESYSPAPSTVNVVKHPIVQHALTVLRNKHTPTKQFRVFSDRLLLMLAMEATRGLPARDEPIETPNGSHTGTAIDRPVIFISLAREGLGLAHGMADFVPGMTIGSISLVDGNHGRSPELRIHLLNAPMLKDARVILFDPVVGAGYSASSALHLIRCSGATDVSLLSFLISSSGLKRVQATMAGLMVWTAAIDTELDPKRGPLPGLGNFAERLYEG